MQYIGKLMRKLDADTVAAIEAALDVQHQGSAKDTLRLHQAEQWRDRLIADDNALTDWLAQAPNTDVQHLRTLVRQARKDASATPTPTESAGAAHATAKTTVKSSKSCAPTWTRWRKPNKTRKTA